MEYLILKWIHILSAILLFGTGLGSAFYKFFTDRSGDINAIAVTNRLVVFADWLITTPTIIIQPITGFWMLGLGKADHAGAAGHAAAAARRCFCSPVRNKPFQRFPAPRDW
jgi:uncharacterized membrane protein